MVEVNPHNNARWITNGLSISENHLELVYRAVGFAACAHRHQNRKYTGEPYLNHCIAVARLVALSGARVCTITAAVLHDVIEDTDVTFDDVLNNFDSGVAQLVMEVTSPTAHTKGNRALHHEVNLAHLAKTSVEAATIKIADIIDNTATIHTRDAAFAAIYLPEKQEALHRLQHGNAQLYARAEAQLSASLMVAKRANGMIGVITSNFLEMPIKIYGQFFALEKMADGSLRSVEYIPSIKEWLPTSKVDMSEFFMAVPASEQDLRALGLCV